jgi:hypothetical protein
MIQKNEKTRGKKWLVKTPTEPNEVAMIKEIADDLGISYVVAALLYTRGYNTPKLAKDFVYMENGKKVVEDTKGFRTKDYIIKRKLMLYVHGIRIKEV